MDMITAINQRYCAREFSERIPPDGLLDTLLAAAVRAPSAGNLQPWHFYVVKDAAARKRLSQAALFQAHVAEAPVVIVACADPERSAARYGRRGKELYCVQDVAAAVENLLLAAVDQGLAGCWVGAFDEKKVAQAVGAPRGRRPLVLVPIGYPARPAPEATPRLPMRDVTSRIG